MCFSAEVYEAYQPLLQRLELPAAVNAALFPASPVGSRQMHGPGGLDTIDRIRPQKSRAEGDNPLPCFSTTPVLIQPRIQLAFKAASTHCWLIFTFLFDQCDFSPVSIGQNKPLLLTMLTRGCPLP